MAKNWNKPARRKKPAVSFTEADWPRLREVLEGDESPEGIVLLIMTATGIRVGDALRISRGRFREGMTSGMLEIVQKGGHVLQTPVDGARDVWERLQKRWKDGATVADWVCPGSTAGAGKTGGCAYKRVARHLRRLGRELGVKGRSHTHRIRRTVAVKALELTAEGGNADPHLVGQLLGHRAASSTAIYTDEMRTRSLVKLQKSLRGA